MNQTAPRRPQVFRIDGQQSDETVFEEAPDAYAEEAREAARARDDTGDDAAVIDAQKQGVIRRSLVSWGGLFWSALSALLLMALGLWFTQLIEDMFARSPGLGYAGLALAALLILALLVLLVRELRAIMRQRHIAQMHIDIGEARASDDTRAARKLMRDLTALYDARPGTAKARARVNRLTGEIVPTRDIPTPPPGARNLYSRFKQYGGRRT